MRPHALRCPNRPCQIFALHYYFLMTLRRFIWILILACLPAMTLHLSAQSNLVDPKVVEEVKTKAEQGDAAAQDKLGFYYARGIIGGKSNYDEAARWYRKSAEQGLAAGQYHLGDCYAKNKGVTGDPVEALKWYRKAADQGYAPAQSILGSWCASGQSVPKDVVEAHKWLSLASQQGDESAKRILSEVEKEMSPEQIEAAKKLVAAFKPVKTP